MNHSTKVRIAIQDFTVYGKGNWKTKSKTVNTQLSFEAVVEKVFALLEEMRGDSQ